MEVKWISSKDNPVDAITKAKPCQALENDLLVSNLRNRFNRAVKYKRNI